MKRYLIATSLLATVLAGILLQMWYIIGIQNIVGGFTADVTVILSVDFVFRMVMGAILVLFVIRLMFSYQKNMVSKKGYREYIQATSGTSVKRTALLGALSFFGYLILTIIIALALGIFNPDLNVLVSGWNWFIFILALVPGIWEELAFRGYILSNIREISSPRTAVLVSGVLFGLFHFSGLVKDNLTMVLLGIVMATAFGVTWGYLVIRSQSVLPAMSSHYAIDVLAVGPLFVNLNSSVTSTNIFFVSLTILYPAITIVLTHYLPNTPQIRG